MTYEDFLKSKVLAADFHGVEVADEWPHLFGFQADIVRWALRKGRAAVFADTGLGKTRMQLTWANHVPGKVLILAPLAVAPQTVREGKAIGIDVAYCRSPEQIGDSRIVITNYEMLDAFDPAEFEGVILDESSILKGWTGKTRTKLINLFAATAYRLCCTATPAPNDHMELGNHAEFLGVMPSMEMLARWFQHDSGDTGVYRLKKHAVADFWRWVSSWAACARKPSDVDVEYDDSLYELPPLIWKVEPVRAPQIAESRGQLFAAGGAPSATSMWKEKGETAQLRCQVVADIVAESLDEPWLIWCDTNDESALLTKLIPDAVEVKGSESVEAKESKLDGFATGKHRVLVTKAKIAGFGLNFQHCSNVAFCGLSYSFEALYQAVRRVWRFGQKRAVTVHLVTADSEVGILEVLERKRADHERMQDQMVEATRKYGVGLQSDRVRIRVEQKKFEGQDYTLYLGDCVEALANVPDNSVSLTVTSPPFSNLFVYSDALQDMGNCSDHDEFFEHMDFLIPELLRVTQPGRLACIHCSDLPIHKHQAGVMGLYDFPGDLVKAFEKHGWVLHSRITVWKDPVVEVTRTKSLGLLHKTFESRREACRVGMADYVLVFRKWTPDMPDKQIQGLAPADSYIGTNPPGPSRNGDTRSESIEIWQKYASPVWFDINQTNVLQFRDARDPQDERHICPLQLDVIERCIWLWSNEGEVILDPFSGVGSVGFCALKTGRKFTGAELKESYAKVAQRHLEAVLTERLQGALL